MRAVRAVDGAVTVVPLEEPPGTGELLTMRAMSVRASDLLYVRLGSRALGDAAALVARGYATEAIGRRPDGTPYWSYHRSRVGHRVELVDHRIQPSLEQQWGTTR
jgi:hypothetical protein